MRRTVARIASVAFLVALAGSASAQTPTLTGCKDLPAGVASLGAGATIEAFAAVPSASVAAIVAPGDGSRSLLRFATGAEPPREVRLSGRVLGLAVARNGAVAYAIVRVLDRKGQIRNVELSVVDLATGRATFGTGLPSGARGLAIGADGSTLLLASRDEVRSFRLPRLESGPLYRVLGANVGVAAIEGATTVVVAQPSRIVLVDLSGAQGRDGLVLGPAADSPAPLRALFTVGLESGPIAVSDDGSAWCVRAAAMPPPPRPPVPEVRADPVPTAPVPVETKPVDVAPVAPAPIEAAPVEAAPAAVAPAPPPSGPATHIVADSSPLPPLLSDDEGSPAEFQFVFGKVEGPSVDQVAAIVFLGPDNVLREAARVVPDSAGGFRARGLPEGAYRVVAAGKGGRVLICDPPFVTVRVVPSGAIEAPVLKVVRAQ